MVSASRERPLAVYYSDRGFEGSSLKRSDSLLSAVLGPLIYVTESPVKSERVDRTLTSHVIETGSPPTPGIPPRPGFGWDCPSSSTVRRQLDATNSTLQVEQSTRPSTTRPYGQWGISPEHVEAPLPIPCDPFATTVPIGHLIRPVSNDGYNKTAAFTRCSKIRAGADGLQIRRGRVPRGPKNYHQDAVHGDP